MIDGLDIGDWLLKNNEQITQALAKSRMMDYKHTNLYSEMLESEKEMASYYNGKYTRLRSGIGEGSNPSEAT